MQWKVKIGIDFLTEADAYPQLPTQPNLNFFFPQIQTLIFLRKTTMNDHNRLLHKFENDQKKFGCVGSCGYAPASVKIF